MSARDDLKACRARTVKLQSTIDELTKQKDAALAVGASEKARADGLEAELATCSSEKVALEERIKELEAQIPPEPQPGPGPTPTPGEILRDTDGQTIPEALADIPAGGTLTLVGEFPVSKEIHFPKNDVTLRCDPGKAKLVAAGVTALDDIIGVKTGPTTGALGITLENLEIDAMQKAKNCVAGWMGLHVKGGRFTGGKMTGLHAYNNGQPADAQILIEDLELDHNGSEAEIGHGAAGSKIFEIHGVTFRRVHAHHNQGNGLWADHDCGRVDLIDCVLEENARRGCFYEKCGRHGEPYPKSYVYGEHMDDFLAKGGKVIYEGGWNIQGCQIQNNAYEGGLFVASVHFRMADTTFGGNKGGIGMMVRNDEMRMNPKASTRADGSSTEPGWMVEDVLLDKSSCTMNGEQIQIGSNVPAGKVVIK